jgi:hypothetical protein
MEKIVRHFGRYQKDALGTERCDGRAITRFNEA